MAEGFLKSFDPSLQVFSAGTNPADQVNSLAIQVMAEAGIDISKNKPKHADQFLKDSFDFVITVCDRARENCPVFSGKVKKMLHIGFDDPAKEIGTNQEKMIEFRRVRDEIGKEFKNFIIQYKSYGKNETQS